MKLEAKVKALLDAHVARYGALVPSDGESMRLWLRRLVEASYAQGMQDEHARHVDL